MSLPKCPHLRANPTLRTAAPGVVTGISGNLDPDLIEAMLSGDSKRWLNPNLEDLLDKCNLTDSELKTVASLPGPLKDRETYPDGVPQVALEMLHAITMGEPHIKIAEWQMKYGTDGLASNIVTPKLLFSRKEMEPGVWKWMTPRVTVEVIVAHPDDAARVARMHLRKQPNFTPVMYGSIISTPDLQSWKEQREHFVTGFLPRGVLERIFPISLARAQTCPEKLRSLCDDGAKPVDMGEFYLFETKAQLQLALFGFDNEFMEKTNKKFRDAMNGKEPRSYPSEYLNELLKQAENAGKAGPSDMHSGCPVVGPLSERLISAQVPASDKFGNAFIFAFAGHDTTGHSLTWLTYELAKNPEYQKRLIHEVDQFWSMLESEGRGMTYMDLVHLPFMTRCFTETLRLWNAVAAGTYRELVRDDTVQGENNTTVELEKGTYLKIPNWSRHRNPDLWGPDVGEFNPDRDFHGDEIWNGDVFRAYNPATPRFSPFTFPPRDCIGKLRSSAGTLVMNTGFLTQPLSRTGKNFAQLESRLILLHVLRDFEFKLTPEYENMDASKFNGLDYGTMGPQDMSQDHLVQRIPGWSSKYVKPLGLPIYALPRNNVSKL